MPKCCVRCYRLISLTFTRPELEQYTVKELRQFLVRNKHRTDNYTEKTDLVEAVMKFSQAHNRSAEDREHIRHVEQLKERMMKETLNSQRPPPPSASTTSGTSHQDSESSASIPQSTPLLVEIIVPSAPSVDNESSTGAFTTPVDPSSAGAASTDDDNPAPFVLPEPADIPPVAMPTPEPTSGTPNKRMTLNQLSKVEDIEGLSVRQLKELLVTNYVDYKGCCERKELMDRVRRLWLDDKKNRGLATDENVASEVDLCKVCMDAIIDCILLECGHMVACTQCGRRMAECPICRHYVSRVVHVFKA